ncbi:MAG: flippase-like domain-containing protein [Actinobacteria bacterium]|nr:flippase-like domain-containing protein [Actinomycetota bacterium]
MKWVLRVAVSLALVGVAVELVAMFPRLTGSTWREVSTRLDAIGLGTGVEIAVLWIGGLIVYTIAMTSSMPGLSHGRALALNLAGSSASNLLPLGGVVGTGINVAMVRSWRLSVRHFASSAAVLNLVNLVTKLALPIIAGLVVSHEPGVAPWLGRSAYVASAVTALIVLVVCWALASRRWAIVADNLLARFGRVLRERGRLSRLAGGFERAGHNGPVAAMQTQVRDVFRLRWFGLTTGMTGYVLMQWALFALCLHAAGVGAASGAVFAAFAVERALTLAVVTPAGTGIAEAAATGLLVALGYSPAASAAGVLLYRLFVYLAEIPIGAAVLGAWASWRLARGGREPVTNSPAMMTSAPPTASSR